jgi:hypothetical protein
MLQHLPHQGNTLIEDKEKQAFFAIEVLVDGTLGDIHAGDYGVNAGLLIASLGKLLNGRL